MCTVSMIMDHYYDWWQQRIPIVPWTSPPLSVPLVIASEVEEFRRLLERAREYDRKHNEPDCELDEKRQKIKDLARSLGVDVAFVDAVASGTG